MPRIRAPRCPQPRCIQWCVVVMFFCAAVASFAFSQSGRRNRIAQAVSGGKMIALQGTAHPLARAEFDQGRVEPDMPVVGASLAFSLPPAQQADLDHLLAAQQEPASPLYHKWLTPEEYAARFGLTDDDVDKASEWLRAQGFTDLKVSRGRTSISFSGTASQVESAFRTELHRYQVHGEKHFANSEELSVPAALANVVLGVRNLNDFRPRPRIRNVPAAHFTSSQSGNHFLSPGDLATIYDIAPLYTAGFDGSGVTIAVMGQTLIDVSDTNAFRSASGLSVNPPQLFQVPDTGVATSCSGDLAEANLDVQWSGGVAKNATVLFVYAGVGAATGSSCNNRNSDVFDALQYTIENNLAPVISISYGLCEADFMRSNELIVQGWIEQANSQGETMTAASGDAGAADCDGDSATTPSVATKGLSVDVPAAIPEVTGVGGTEFMGDTTSGADAPYWAAATSGSVDNVSSALTYIPEQAWNDSPVTGTGVPPLATTLSAGGGGVSTVFNMANTMNTPRLTKPTWQMALTPNDNARDVPDVSLAGSPGHDSYLVCSEGSCVTGFRETSGNLNAFGGTSVSAQVMAGMLAIVTQATQTNGLGNANVELYKLKGTTAAAFHDITAGNNIVPCTPGTPTGGTAAFRCPSTGAAQIGYAAKTGYDLATGLGSLDLDTLARAWTGFSATPSFSVSAPPITIASAGTSGPSTVTVSSTSGFTGTINLTCAFVPPPSAGTGLTCAFNPTSVALSGSTTSATSTLIVTTTAAHAVANTSASGRNRGHWFTASGGALLACFFVIGIPSRKRRNAIMLVLICGALVAAGIGCGGGSSSGGSTTTVPTAATPVLNPASGTFTGNVTVNVTDTTSGALLFCTADGTTPTASSPACATQNLTSTTTLKAIAVESGFNSSSVASGTYTIQSGTASGNYVVKVTARSTSPAVLQTVNVPVTVN